MKKTRVERRAGESLKTRKGKRYAIRQGHFAKNLRWQWERREEIRKAAELLRKIGVRTETTSPKQKPLAAPKGKALARLAGGVGKLASMIGRKLGRRGA